MLHLNITIPEGHLHGNKASRTITSIQALSSLADSVEKYFSPVDIVNDESGAKQKFSSASRPKRLFISLHLPHKSTDFAKVLVSLSITFDLWIVHVSGDKVLARNNVVAMAEIVQSAQLPTSIGLGGCLNPIELDWYLTKIPPETLKFVHLGDVVLPDLKLHSIELAHTLGYNTIFSITAEALRTEISTHPVLVELAAKYNVPSDAVLLKCLLQLGCVVLLPLSTTINAAYAQEHVSRLCHPFVHRKPFVSSNKVVSLQILEEDLAVLTAASEAYEAQEDASWQPHVHARSVNRELTYAK